MSIITIPICGIKHSVLEYSEAILIFNTWVQRRDKSRQVCTSNVHTIVMCQTDKELADITNKADMVTMDGQPMRWYANLVHKVGLRDRVCGPELMQRCLAAGVDKGWKHFFLGSTEAVLEGLCKRLSENYPGIKIVGCYSPPFRTLNEEEHQMIVNMINSSNADFLWVGLGAPKQEKWIAKNLHLLHIPVQIGVGAAFDFHSGNIRRAPAILQKYGFEWLYRIIQDPRLLKRYFMTNPVFLFMFFRDYFQARIISSRRLLDKS